MNYGYVYVITCLMNGKQYVGQTTYSVMQRIKRHLASARYNSGDPLHVDIRRYGENQFDFKTVSDANSQEDLDQLEDKFILELNTIVPNGYNRRGGGTKGKYPKETILKSNLFEEVGEALYGERWKAPLARDLDISQPTLREWRENPNKPRIERLHRIIIKKLRELHNLRIRIRETMARLKQEEAER